jgi:hypothetical protein
MFQSTFRARLGRRHTERHGVSISYDRQCGVSPFRIVLTLPT